MKKKVFHKFEELFVVLLDHEFEYGYWYLCKDKDGNEILSEGYVLYENTWEMYNKLKGLP
jgi:hypothetical protein